MSITKKFAGGSVRAVAFGLALMAVLAGPLSAQERGKKGRAARVAPKLPAYNNADFYTPDGKFNEEAAKKAYFDLMRYYNYPVNETIRQNLFVSDMGLGKFTEVGLSVVILINEKEANYAALEIFLLPNQMIPEHWHVALPDDGVKEKMESWIVRYGTTFTYGVGEPTDPIAVKIPDSQKDYVTVRHEQQLKPGESTGVAKAEDKHWQLAGPEGCILSEIATYHDGKAVRFSDPNIKF
ncbi:MAG: D-lyxose/D-mannose family sugar isomerase [Pirellulaceae bacterium]